MFAPIVLGILVAHAAATAQASAAQQPPAPPVQTTPEKPWPPAGVFRPGDGVMLPRLIKETRPGYTADAVKAGVQGGIKMEAVVEADGTVGEVRVVHSLDRKFGLDEEAVKTVKQWRFAPGTKDDVAVPVLVEVEMTFTIGLPKRKWPPRQARTASQAVFVREIEADLRHGSQVSTRRLGCGCGRPARSRAACGDSPILDTHVLNGVTKPHTTRSQFAHSPSL